MSSSNNNRIDPGCATIIGAVIGAIALVVGTAIGAVLGARSQPIQVFLGVDTPTAIAQTNILGLPFPQPTYTLLPTYTPYPTLTPARTIVVPKPITVVPTLSTDQQNPLPGSAILAGQPYTRNRITITPSKSVQVSGNAIGISIVIENQSSQQVIILWKNSYVHLKDNDGKNYPQASESKPDWNSIKQFAIANGETKNMPTMCCIFYPDAFDFFQGPIDPSAKYLIFTIDQLGAMSNMNWRYDLQ